MKNPAPSFQFYPADFLSDANVVAMTDKEVGRYIKALCHCWIEDGLLEDSRIVERYLKGSSTITRCFFKQDGKYRHKRLDLERQKQRRWREKCSVGGKKSAEIKRLVKGSSTKRQLSANTPSSSSSSTPVFPPFIKADETSRFEKLPYNAQREIYRLRRELAEYERHQGKAKKHGYIMLKGDKQLTLEEIEAILERIRAEEAQAWEACK